MKKKIENGIKALRNNKGFTLIELIVVVGIIGILVGIASPRFTGFNKDARVATLQADVKTLETAALVYNVENEGWPVTDETTPTAETVTELATATGLSANKFFEIDAEKKGATSKSALSDTVKNLEGDYTDFVIVIEGDEAGRVYHKTGKENKNGDKVFSIGVETPAP